MPILPVSSKDQVQQKGEQSILNEGLHSLCLDDTLALT